MACRSWTGRGTDNSVGRRANVRVTAACVYASPPPPAPPAQSGSSAVV